MVWIASNTFNMGTNDQRAYDPEMPSHKVKVKGFWMDKTEVTNLQFKAFTEATNYKTVAEREIIWEDFKQQLPEGTAKPADSLLVPGSIVFIQPEQPVNPTNPSLWFSWVTGANWQHPEGPQSNLSGRWDHPVVHIAYEDALAYATWNGKRLPTEAEWELAAQSNIMDNPWENRGNSTLANTFQGIFPYKNALTDGFLITAPVKSFPPNQLGLYDMIGNVWEWTSDWYHTSYYKSLDAKQVTDNPIGAKSFYDPNEPYTPKRVIKGGSFLCSNAYCSNYRVSARTGSAIDTGTSNVGFRCVKDE
ncbi:MAG: formylglycine-generating enzyme family protein [Bacteroidetes bacterium]|nr:MAG: formylglycine-generating enzyme family protein [Bacteroidota bacterium]